MLAALLLLIPLDDGPTGQRAFDPYRATSPSGRHFVEIAPSHRNGSGPCQVLIGESNFFFADEELPLTLRDAAVDDAGDVVGWCSEDPYLGEKPRVFLRPRGGRFRECALPAGLLEGTCFGLGLVLQPEHQRALLRIDRRDARHGEVWWPLALPSGQWGTRIDPERLKARNPRASIFRFFQLLPLGRRDALLAVEPGHYTVFDADGRAQWDLWDNSAAFVPESQSEPVDTLGPFPGGFTLRLLRESASGEDPSLWHEERIYTTRSECADLCVTEAGGRVHDDLPGEPEPAFTELKLERIGEPRTLEQIPGVERGSIGSGATDAQVWCDPHGMRAWTANAEFARRVDDKWLGWIHDTAPLEDGGLVIADRAWGWRGEDHTRVVVFSARGEPLEQYVLPGWHSFELHARGDWICALSWIPHAVLLVRRSTREVFRLPLEGPYGTRHPTLHGSAPELWILDARESALTRYRLPGT